LRRHRSQLAVIHSPAAGLRQVARTASALLYARRCDSGAVPPRMQGCTGGRDMRWKGVYTCPPNLAVTAGGHLAAVFGTGVRALVPQHVTISWQLPGRGVCLCCVRMGRSVGRAVQDCAVMQSYRQFNITPIDVCPQQAPARKVAHANATTLHYFVVRVACSVVGCGAHTCTKRYYRRPVTHSHPCYACSRARATKR
jgi:hypothetical protein